MRRSPRSSLSLGRKLYRRQESQVLHWLPRHAGYDVRVDALRLHKILQRGLRCSLRGGLVGCAANSWKLFALGRLGDAERFAALHVGDDSSHLPNVPGHVSRNDDK